MTKRNQQATRLLVCKEAATEKEIVALNSSCSEFVTVTRNVEYKLGDRFKEYICN